MLSALFTFPALSRRVFKQKKKKNSGNNVMSFNGFFFNDFTLQFIFYLFFLYNFIAFYYCLALILLRFILLCAIVIF